MRGCTSSGCSTTSWESPAGWLDKLRDAVLGMMTHLNYDGPDTNEPMLDDSNLPKNRNKFDGLTLLLMGTVGALIHAVAMPHNFFSVGFFEKNTSGDSHHPLGTFFAAVVFGAWASAS